MKIIIFFSLITEIIKYILACYALFERKVDKRYGVGAAVSLCGIVVAGSITNDVGVCSMIILPFLAVGLFITTESPIKEKISYLFKIIFLMLCIDYVVQMFIELIDDWELSDENGWLISNITLIILYAVICIIRRRFNTRKNKKVQVLVKAILYCCIAVMAFTIPLTVSGIVFFAEHNQNSEPLKGVRLLSAISMLSMVMLIMFVFYIDKTNKQIKKYLEIENTLKETQKNYYETIIQREKETQKFRHDILNHIICIRELAEQQELESVKEYIDDMQGEIIKIQKQCYKVGNTVIDAILNYYLQMLDSSVKIKVEGYLIDDISISDVDLCTIFSNIMKNSVEELMRQQNEIKFLNVKIHIGEKDFTLEVLNSVQEKERVVKGTLPLTTKKDKDNHGIGMRNIKETVERNKGVFYWGIAEESFWVKVILPLRSRG